MDRRNIPLVPRSRNGNAPAWVRWWTRNAESAPIYKPGEYCGNAAPLDEWLGSKVQRNYFITPKIGTDGSRLPLSQMENVQWGYGVS